MKIHRHDGYGFARLVPLAFKNAQVFGLDPDGRVLVFMDDGLFRIERGADGVLYSDGTNVVLINSEGRLGYSKGTDLDFFAEKTLERDERFTAVPVQETGNLAAELDSTVWTPDDIMALGYVISMNLEGMGALMGSPLWVMDLGSGHHDHSSEPAPAATPVGSGSHHDYMKSGPEGYTLTFRGFAPPILDWLEELITKAEQELLN